VNVTLRTARLADMPPATLYSLMRLRVDVFVVEQRCAYPELDGRDLEPEALQMWAESDDAVLATLRVLHDGDDRRIGRVATAATARGRGLAAQLMHRAVAECDGRLIRLDAQAHLADWYARFGFVVDGDEFIEDAIPHVPMARAAGAPDATDGAR
jgi:ElaA protein